MNSEIFEDLNATARSQGEFNLIDQYVRGEKLRTWLTTTKEGQAISEQIEYMYCRAMDNFATCDINDADALQKAKLDITVAKRVFEIFNGIFQEAHMAENILSEE